MITIEPQFSQSLSFKAKQVMFSGKSFTFFVSVFFLGLLMTACSSQNIVDKSQVTGVWKLADVKALSNKQLSFDEEAALKTRVAKGETIGIFNDNSFTMLTGEGEYQTGKWNFISAENIITLDVSGKTILAGSPKLTKDATEATFLIVSVKGKNYDLIFRQDSEPRKVAADDAFHPSNNEWRISSKTPETQRELKEKVRNYIKHLALILKYSAEDEKDVVSFTYSTGPIKIYRSAIGIYPFEIVPESWKNSFSSEEKAMEAYLIYEQYLRDNNYNGASTGEWVLDDSNILLSIYSEMSK